MKVDVNRIRSLQEAEVASFYRQRTENENKIAKIAEAIKKYPDIGEEIGLGDRELSYKAFVPEAYVPVAEIDKPKMRDQTVVLQKIVDRYNQIVMREYERALELQQEADKIVSTGG